MILFMDTGTGIPAVTLFGYNRATSSGSNVTTLDIPVPAGGVTAGQLLVAVIYNEYFGTAPNFSTPDSGWKKYIDYKGNSNVAIFVKVASGSEADITINTTGSQVAFGWMLVFDGAAPRIMSMQGATSNDNSAGGRVLNNIWGYANGMFIEAYNVDGTPAACSWNNSFIEIDEESSGNSFGAIAYKAVGASSARSGQTTMTTSAGGYGSGMCFAVPPADGITGVAPTVISSQFTGHAGGGTSLTATMPGSLSAGNLLIAYVCQDNNSAGPGVIAGTGWSRISAPVYSNGGFSSSIAAILIRVSDGTETTATFTGFPATTGARAALVVNTDSRGISNAMWADRDDSTYPFVDTYVPEPGMGLIFGHSLSTGTVFTYNNSYTSQGNFDYSTVLRTNWAKRDFASATTTGVTTLSGSGTKCMVQVILLGSEP